MGRQLFRADGCSLENQYYRQDVEGVADLCILGWDLNILYFEANVFRYS